MSASSMTSRTRMIVRYWLYFAINTALVAISLYQGFKVMAAFQNGSALPGSLVYITFYFGFALLLIAFTVKTTLKTMADLSYFNVTEQIHEWMDDNERKEMDSQ